MTNIARHEITFDELRACFGNRVKPSLSDQQLEAMLIKFNTGMRWPDDPPPSPGEPGYCKVEEGNDDKCRDVDKGLKGAQALYESLAAVMDWSNIWTPDDGLETRLTEALEQVLFPFGKHSAKKRRMRASKEWNSYAKILADFIIGEFVKAGHVQPAISSNSVIVRVIHEVMNRKRVPGSNAVARAAIARFLERWDKAYGLTPKHIALLRTKASRVACVLNREIGLCHLSDSEFALRVGPHHEGKGCRHCKTEQFYQ